MLRRSPIALSLLVSVIVAATGCSKRDNAPPVATVSFTASKTRVPLGSPVDLTYRFDVAPTAAIQGDYRVFVHVNNPDGTLLWGDDHDPEPMTSTWKPGQKVEYTHTRFIPVVPYIGEATVVVGLYKDNDRLPLQGPDPADRESNAREYKVGTIQLLPSSENIFIIYKSGWHPMEFAPEDPTVSWRWTQKTGLLSFRNPHKDALLYLEYDARPDLFPGQPQQIAVYAGDQLVKTLTANSTGRVLERIPLSAAQLGAGDMTDLRIDVDRTFVPAKLPAGGKDVRELGVRIYQAYVESR